MPDFEYPSSRSVVLPSVKFGYCCFVYCFMCGYVFFVIQDSEKAMIITYRETINQFSLNKQLYDHTSVETFKLYRDKKSVLKGHCSRRNKSVTQLR